MTTDLSIVERLFFGGLVSQEYNNYSIPPNCYGCFCSMAYCHQFTQGLANSRNNLI